MLDLHHHNLSILFPAFAAACSRNHLVEAVAGVVDRWSRTSRHSSAAAADSDPTISHLRMPSEATFSAPAICLEASIDGLTSASETDTADSPGVDRSYLSALKIPFCSF